MKEQVEAFVEGIDYDSIVATKDLIQEAEATGGRLHVTGIGKPGHVSGYAASLFSSTGTPPPTNSTAPSARTARPARPSRATS